MTCIKQDLHEHRLIPLLAQGRSLVNPYEVLARTPLSVEGERYAYAGVMALPILALVYLERFQLFSRRFTLAMETRARVVAAQGRQPEGDDRNVDYPLLYEDDLPARVLHLSSLTGEMEET